MLGSVALPREVSDDRRLPHQPRQLQGVIAQDAPDAVPGGLRTLRAAADGAGSPGATGGEDGTLGL